MKIKNNYIGNIKTCIKRFYTFEKLVSEWMNRGGGNMEIFSFLNLEGDLGLDLPRHPFLDYTEDEKLAFKQCFGMPIKIPKDLNIRVSIREFLDEVIQRRELMREVASMTRQSRFRNTQFQDKPNVNRNPKNRKRVVNSKRKKVKT